MMKTLTVEKAQALLQDLIGARHDLLQLAEAHGLPPEELARWVSRAEVRQTLAALCVLSDYQTQLLLSQYRRLAANRLLRMATGEDEAVSEPARKACVDLLHTELQRVTGSIETAQESATSGLDVPMLRQTLYGDPSSTQE